jgi:hypothetical protein
LTPANANGLVSRTVGEHEERGLLLWIGAHQELDDRQDPRLKLRALFLEQNSVLELAKYDR